MRSPVLALAMVIFQVMLARSASSQSNWSQFRGSRGSGIAPDQRPLPSALDPSNNLRWKCIIPPGHSSPCIWGDRIFVTGATDRDVQTICIDRDSGQILWVREALSDTFESRHRINSPATPTATTDGERVFVYFGSCGLMCYDFQGNEKWLRRMRIPENMYGTSASPIIAGDSLIFLNDNANKSYLVALDPDTGETIWRIDRPNFTAGWSTPLHFDNHGVDEIVVYGVGWITAYALEDGAERWSIPGLTDEPCITPIASDGLIYFTSYNMRTNPEVIGLPQYEKLIEQYDADGNGTLSFPEIRQNESILSRNDADGEGDHSLAGFFRFLDEDRNGFLSVQEWKKMFSWLDNFKFANALIALRPPSSPGSQIETERETTMAWQHNRGVPECPSPLVYEGLVYMIKNGGIVSCLDAKTGELKYQARLDSGGPYYASPVAGDGKIYTASARGVVTVFEAGDTLKILSRNDLEDRIMATPALVDGTIYVRTDAMLYAFGQDH